MSSSAVEERLATSIGHDRASTGWWVVFGSTLALIVGNGPIILFTFGVLLQPISAEFHWPRGGLAAAVVTSHIAGALMMPFVGILIDRFGVKRIALPAITLFAATTAYAGTLGNNLTSFIVLYGLLGIFGAGHSTLIYARAVSTWFDAQRGLALGITLAGIGIGAAVIPKFTHYFVDGYGWREAYFALGALLFVVGFTSVALFVKDRPVQSNADVALIEGLSLRQALTGYRFWFASLAMMFAAAAINGTIAHIVPVLSDRGISAGTATTAVAVSGFSLIVGRMLSGFAMDRYQGPHVAALFFLIPLVGMALLGFGATGAMAIIAAVFLGLGIGAEGDIMAYLTGRYFGMKHYGLIYGCVLAFFTLGSGLGPWLMAHAFDLYRSYAIGLIGLGLALFAAVVLVATLGAYPYPPRQR